MAVGNELGRSGTISSGRGRVPATVGARYTTIQGKRRELFKGVGVVPLDSVQGGILVVIPTKEMGRLYIPVRDFGGKLGKYLLTVLFSVRGKAPSKPNANPKRLFHLPTLFL